MLRSTMIYFTFICLTTAIYAQRNQAPKSTVEVLNLEEIYQKANTAYDQEDFAESARQFDLLFGSEDTIFNQNIYYNAACSYALNKEIAKSFDRLEIAVNKFFFTDINHIQSDPDLEPLRNSPRWKTLLVSIEENIKSAPERKRKKIKAALMATKTNLAKDSGQLWGFDIWDPKILVIDFDQTIYSLDNLSESITTDSILFFKQFETNALSYTNTTQNYEGTQYATLLYNYIDSRITLIHELFHLQHFRFIGNNTMQAEPVEYLDKYEARLLLRLEYEALRNALRAANKGKSIDYIKSYIRDALSFRKSRHQLNMDDLQAELELETVEGLANYTGIKLSGIPKSTAECHPRN